MPMKFPGPGIVALVFLIGCGQSSEMTDQGSEWVALFDGATLTGWEQLNGTAAYSVANGAVVGRTAEGSPNSFLCTIENFSDFELEFEVNVDARLNSGVQIRSRLKPAGSDEPGRIFGPQVEIEASGDAGGESGYVYGEATGHGWLTPENRLIPHRHFRDGEWNAYRVVAEGPRIRTFINGEPIEDLTHEEIFSSHPEGKICLQVHSIPTGAGPYEVQWRDIRVRT